MIKAVLVVLLMFSFSLAKVNVLVTYPWIESLVKAVGGDNVDVKALARGSEDPHFVVPKPSYISMARRADLLIINGASLEVGFVPVIVQQSNNPNIQPGKQGFLDLSTFVELIQKPERVSREMGDVHPEGNPHFHLDPYNIPPLAKAIKDKLCSIDSKNCSKYESNLENFLIQWNSKLKEWDSKMKSSKGKKVIAYHRLYDYFLKRYGIELVGTIEPLPGINPNPKHTENLINLLKEQKVSYILQDVYHDKKAAQYISSKTGVPYIVLPHDVASLPEIKSLSDLFDYMVNALTR